ncbi:hypothetical protein [Patulibacter defluvii]|uniref:hypothetical protein n=1 Tax=Patulibacter defluvii TaxID=3095358 RepID=UPI002A75FA3F|nr:hypothetical protein [Patulibacter sp. DM4]
MIETFTIDHGTPGALALSTDVGTYQVTTWSAPPPERRLVTADAYEGSILDEDGWQNRELSLTVAVVATTDVALDDALSPLLERVAKLQREKGTVRWSRSGRQPLWFDVETATTPGPTFDLTYYAAKAATVELKLTCRPLLRGTERQIGTGTRTAGQRFLTVADLDVPGDVPALARLEYSGASVAQSSLLWAIDQPDATSKATGVQVAASTLQTPGTITTQVGSLSPQIVRMSAVPSGVPAGLWQPCLYLHTAAGAPIGLTGSYRVLARVSCASTTTLQLRLRWTAGRDAVSLAENPWWQSAPMTDWWELADLGTVTIPPGSDGLDGVIERVTPYGSDTHLDLLLFVPADCAGSAYAAPREIGGTIAADSMTGSGVLGGSAAAIGGSWTTHSGTGDPDFARGTTGATRTTPTSGAGRMAGIPVGSSSARRVQVTAGYAEAVNPVGGPIYGAFLASDDGWKKMRNLANTTANVWVVGAWLEFPSPLDQTTGMRLTIRRTIGAGANDIVSIRLGPTVSYQAHRMTLSYDPTVGIATAEMSDATGRRIAAPAVAIAAPPATTFVAGLVDFGAYGASMTHIAGTYSNFAVEQVQPGDRALYPSRTASVATGRAYRQGATSGTKDLIAAADWPTLPPSGRDGRLARVVMGTSRDDMRTLLDSSPDDLFTGKVFATPRYLQVPDGDA